MNANLFITLRRAYESRLDSPFLRVPGGAS